MTGINATDRIAIATLTGATGVAVAVGITLADPYFNGTIGFWRVAGGGALIAGLGVAAGFGRAGHWGWLLSLLTFAGATVVGAIIAFFLMQMEAALGFATFGGSGFSGIANSIVAPIFVVSTTVGEVLVGKVWIVCWVVLHLSARRLRHAREAANVSP